MTLDIVVGFFILGAFAQLCKSDLKLPEGLYQSCTILLLLAIGLKGGIALSTHSSPALLVQSLIIVAFGVVLTLIAFPALYYIGGWKRIDAAATAAHYGSISFATYAVAVSTLETMGIAYEAYFPLFVALLEVPAILIGIMLVQKSGSRLGLLKSFGDAKLMREVFLNKGIVLLLGGIAIGAWAGEQTQKVMPLFGSLFHGVLALFLLEMGRIAAQRIDEIRKQGAFLTTFSVVMPLIGGTLGALLGKWMGFSPGGVFLIAVLGSSASYIAVPAAMATALPNANSSVSITASLAITFPFNVLVALPAYLAVIQAWS